MRNKIIAASVSLLVILGLFFAFNSTGLDSNKVRIANLPIAEGLPLYIAIDKGYFKEVGVDVEYVKFEAPNQIIDAVMSGKVDMVSPSGAMGISAVADSKNPGKLKIYASSGGDMQNPVNGLFVQNDSNIKSVKELKGKKLGILPGIQWRTISTEILSQNDLEVGKDVTLVELAPGLHATALASGEVDAVLTLEPGPTIIREKKLGVEIKPSPVYNISNPFHAGAGIVNVDFLNKHPDLVKKVISALDKANKEIRDNPNEARTHLKGYTALTDDLITKVTLPQIEMWNEIDEKDIEAIQKFYAIFYKHKVVSAPLDFKSLMYKE